MKNMLLYPLMIVSVFMLLLAPGCTLNLFQQSPSPVAATIVVTIPTEIPPVPSATATETPLPPPTPSPQPEPISASVSVDVINLRDGPGTVFRIISTALKDTPLALLGKDQGNNWVLVRTPDGKISWVVLTFITLQGDLSSLPTLPIDYAYTIEGRVVDTSGGPIEGLTIAIYQQVGGEERRTDAATQANGEFSAFVPLTGNSTWNVEVVGVNCTSRIVDASCKFSGRFDPVYTRIELPGQNFVEFIYHQN